MSSYYPLYVCASIKNSSQEVGVNKLLLYDDANGLYGSLELQDGVVEFRDAGGTLITFGGGSGDMILSAVQTVTGAKTFNDARLLLRNVANTFSAQFTSTITAARTYTLPDATGTVALTSDLSSYATTAAVAAGYQPLDSDLTAIAASSTTSFGRSLLTQADAAATRTTIGAGTSSFDGVYSSLTSIPSTFAPSAHNHAATEITSGTLPVARLSFTKSELNTAVSDGDVLYVGDAISSITVREIDGTPSIAATVIEFSNGHVTDQGGGVARVTIGGGGGGGGSTPTDITVANEATDTTCFVAFFTAATGDLGPKTNTSLTYNSATSSLACTTFVGALTGNASTVTTNANLTGHVTSTGNATVLGSFTKAQLDTAVSDGNVLYVGDVTSNATHTGDVTGSTALTIKTDVALAGNPTTTTQATTDNSTRIATTAFVKTAIPGLLVFKIDTTATGAKNLFFRVPYACTITGWELVANTSGSVVVDIWKDTYANYPPVVGDAITGSAKPTLSSEIKAASTTLTGWTTALAAGDYLEVNVDSVTTITNVTLSLAVTRS